MILHDPFEVEAAGGLAVHGARAVPGVTDARAALAADLGGASTVEEALGWLLSRIDPDGYLGVLAFADRGADAGLGVIRHRLADHAVRAVTFGQLEAAQATGDRQALARRGPPLVHLHLTDRTAGVARLLAAADALPWVS